MAPSLDSAPNVASDDILTRTGRLVRWKRTRSNTAAGAVVRPERQDFWGLSLRTGREDSTLEAEESVELSTHVLCDCGAGGDGNW